MAEVDALPAASVLLLRPSAGRAPYDVLMIRRAEQASFAPNAWVFPGGVVDAADHELSNGSPLEAARVAAARELFEETGVWLGDSLDDAEHKRRRLLAGSLSFRQLLQERAIDFTQFVWTSHWITPLGVRKRFDTRFFLASTGRDTEASAEQVEAVDAVWIPPGEALVRHRAGEWKMVFPTIRNLEAIEGHESIAALIASRRNAAIEPVQPSVVDGKIFLP